jgi:hypothetical protein
MKPGHRRMKERELMQALMAGRGFTGRGSAVSF